METVLAPLRGMHAFNSAVECIRKNKMPIQAAGCMDSQKCHLIYGMAQETSWRVIIAQNEIKARELMEDYRTFDRETLYFPAKDVIFYSADVHGNALGAERLKVIQALLEKESGTIVTTMDAGMEILPALSVYGRDIQKIELDSVIDLEKFSHKLTNLGYKRSMQVENPGEYSIRGGIVDVYPITADCPYRIELFGDEVDTIRSFDAESQRTIENIEELVIYPASELTVTDEEIKEAFQNMAADEKKMAKQFQKDKNHEAFNRIHENMKTLREDYEAYGSRMGLDSLLAYFSMEKSSLFDYFADRDVLFFVDEIGRCLEKTNAVEEEFRESMEGRLEKGYILPGQMNRLRSSQEVLAVLLRNQTVFLTMLDSLPKEVAVEEAFHFQVQSIGSYNKHFELLVEDLKKWKKDGCRVLLLSASRTRAERLSKDLNEYGVEAFYREAPDIALEAGQIMVTFGVLHRGFSYVSSKFVIVTEGDIFGARQKRSRKKKREYSGKAIQSFNELNVGDYVVHENHGLGIYRGIEKIEVDFVTKDYIKIEYGDGGNLYVPASGLDVLQKFAGQEAKKPKLNKLNSTEWKKTKSRVKGAVEEIAKDLVLLYAKRQEQKGFAFGADSVWQHEFEELFPYEETQDQLKAIEDTKKDMESTKIMDRLICGDVGYGKTEIALRAAFKAVDNGRQVAFLVPTTILAQQHFNTLEERLGDFPITVEMLSRFRTPAQQKKALAGLKNGQVDIVVGTHRLLSKDVEFKNLGLLIVDEEQRFGVKHKEQIKKLKDNVDVLTLSATPIPRTLHMSLVGIRDMSVLEEPPVDRLPIQTFVMEHNMEIIREAIHRELARGGQVFFVYNRVHHIDEVALEIQKQVPEARVEFAHGQMSERQLENIMMDFINGEIDVLVATTIIETGLDISNVNTIIIDNADQMGLSQLYQLRGRVGRSHRTAYAFLMYRRNKMLKEVAEKRLAAIREYTELGSGIKVAMRDLEIRGAGNVLGAAQSGHMQAVGYDLYCKMLNDAVRKLKGEMTEEESFETTIDLQVDAYIPPAYIPSEFQKLDIYKRIAGIETTEEYADMEAELVDRFGDVPKPAMNLLRIALLKADAHKAYISQIIQKPNGIRFYLEKNHLFCAERMPELLQEYQGEVKYVQEKEPYLLLAVKKKTKPVTVTRYSTKVVKSKEKKKDAAEEIFIMVETMIKHIGGLYEKK